MDEQTLKQYLADSPPTVVRLEIEPHFNALTDQQKLYAHHLSRLVSLYYSFRRIAFGYFLSSTQQLVAAFTYLQDGLFGAI
jgi:hypothetical protein